MMLYADAADWNEPALRRIITDHCSPFGAVANITMLWGYGRDNQVGALVEMAEPDQTLMLRNAVGSSMFGCAALILVEKRAAGTGV